MSIQKKSLLTKKSAATKAIVAKKSPSIRPAVAPAIAPAVQTAVTTCLKA